MLHAPALTVPVARARDVPPVDPLGFLAGRRYTCYCGRTVEGTMLCPSCADEMLDQLVAGRRPLPRPPS